MGKKKEEKRRWTRREKEEGKKKREEEKKEGEKKILKYPPGPAVPKKIGNVERNTCWIEATTLYSKIDF